MKITTIGIDLAKAVFGDIQGARWERKGPTPSRAHLFRGPLADWQARLANPPRAC